MPIDSPIELDRESAAAFGLRSLVILPGNYRIDYGSHQNGEVVVDVIPDYIHIGVNWGRRVLGCHGFGICSIVVDIPTFPDQNDRLVNSYAAVDGENLHVAFAERLPEQGDSVVIDEDIELDPKTAARFGAKRAHVARGTYLVDYSSSPYGSVDLPVVRFGITITIWIKIGRRSDNCRGFGICDFGIDQTSSERWITADARIEGTTLTLAFGKKAPDADEYITIDEPIQLDKATATLTDSRTMTVLPGRYKVDYSDNPFGTVQLNTFRFGVTIDIEVGRRSRDCRGFGICSITVDFSMRTVSTLATIEGDKLRLVLRTPLPESGEELMIDEDIVLDADLARGLGRRSVTLKRGAYRPFVDSDGEQVVDIDVASNGIVITITFGLPGCRPGFGICRIDIDHFATERSAQAVAAVENGELVLDLLGEAPDRASMMVIGEQVILDSALLQSLGYDTAPVRAIRAGAYQVDTSENRYGTLRLATEVVDRTSSVDEQSHSLTSTTSAAPNPTSGATEIRFSLPRPAAVTLTIVDGAGGLVGRPLENVTMGAGGQSARFDASGLPAGIYFYQIEANGARMSGTVVKR